MFIIIYLYYLKNCKVLHGDVTPLKIIVSTFSIFKFIRVNVLILDLFLCAVCQRTTAVRDALHSLIYLSNTSVDAQLYI